MTTLVEKENFMSENNKRRLAKDVVRIIKNPLNDHGIYYKHDDTNMLKGYALIIGPTDTIYEGGYYLFEFNYTTNYPYEPPKLKYLTNDGKTRFNPNLYRNGKVCISILNTWKGEQWTSCQNINTILLTLVTLFHNKPLLNEPGITEKYKWFDNYNKILTYKNFEVAIYKIINKEILTYEKTYKLFYDIMKKHFLQNKEDILKRIQDKCSLDEKEFYVSIYSMTNVLYYKKLYENINSLT